MKEKVIAITLQPRNATPEGVEARESEVTSTVEPTGKGITPSFLENMAVRENHSILLFSGGAIEVTESREDTSSHSLPTPFTAGNSISFFIGLLEQVMAFLSVNACFFDRPVLP